MKNINRLFLILLVSFTTCTTEDFTRYVDPNIGGVSLLLTTVKPTVHRPHSMVRVFPVTKPGLEDRYLSDKCSGTGIGAYVSFRELTGPIVVRIGISYISDKQAKANLQKETSGKDFEQVKTESYKIWKTALGCIRIEGGTKRQKRIFYTSLGKACCFAGRLSEKKTGRYVEVWTTQPALQIYAGYYIPDLIVNGKKSFGKYSGFALETQHFADSINHSHFPSIVLNPDEPFYQKTVYRFGILED